MNGLSFSLTIQCSLYIIKQFLIRNTNDNKQTNGQTHIGEANKIDIHKNKTANWSEEEKKF